MTEEQFSKIYGALVGCATLQAKEVLSVEDVKLLTGLSRCHIYKLVSMKKIPYYKDPSGRRVHFKKKEIEDWLCAYRVPTYEETAQIAAVYATNAKQNKR